MDTPLRKEMETPLRNVRTNIVQSIRAFRVQDLQDAAQGLGHHFLYANLANAQSKQDVLDMIAGLLPRIHRQDARRTQPRCPAYRVEARQRHPPRVTTRPTITRVFAKLSTDADSVEIDAG